MNRGDSFYQQSCTTRHFLHSSLRTVNEKPFERFLNDVRNIDQNYIRDNKDVTYTREQILGFGFKIRQEDFNEISLNRWVHGLPA